MIALRGVRLARMPDRREPRSGTHSSKIDAHSQIGCRASLTRIVRLKGFTAGLELS